VVSTAVATATRTAATDGATASTRRWRR
jgi:hypothetical protein